MHPEAMVSPSSVMVPVLQSLSQTIKIQRIFPTESKPVPEKKVSRGKGRKKTV
jgi:hypothetical protein